jgi:hypothetical protein
MRLHAIQTGTVAIKQRQVRGTGQGFGRRLNTLVLATEAIRSNIRKETVIEETFLSPTRRMDGKKMEMRGPPVTLFCEQIT